MNKFRLWVSDLDCTNWFFQPGWVNTLIVQVREWRQSKMRALKWLGGWFCSIIFELVIVIVLKVHNHTAAHYVNTGLCPVVVRVTGLWDSQVNFESHWKIFACWKRYEMFGFLGLWAMHELLWKKKKKMDSVKKPAAMWLSGNPLTGWFFPLAICFTPHSAQVWRTFTSCQPCQRLFLNKKPEDAQ